MKAVKVRKEEAEKIRKWLEKNGYKDKDRRIRVEDGYVIIPVIETFNIPGSYDIIQDKNPVFKEKKDFRSIVENVAGYYPKYADFKIFGKVGVVKLPEEITQFSKRIADELMRTYRLKAVWLDRGRHGMLRKPEMELLAGQGSETEVKEHGYIYRFDVTKVMFSQGNKFEKMRIAGLVEDGEIVADMFAGIGYFTIPVAKHSRAKKIYAFEINPDSYTFLLENIKINKVNGIVPILGDSMHIVPEGFADRVIMGHINAEPFIPVAIRALRDEGWIHYHESTPEKILSRPVERIKKHAEKQGAEVKEINLRKVKNYSPRVLHVVVDARIKINRTEV
ncbi:class I SAM-dependent methyltransferase family protein [Geoglobus acetivorans]|uniref:Class I SAM-dependent methyltransferase family protein n=1 Tax=Geoglobus acetivorans TaxID=565033 RepID=A0ABZ3H218_GEOAI|nr:class I SAM-dependent methyltransferase family protein [Geoglobus acetivorans]